MVIIRFQQHRMFTFQVKTNYSRYRCNEFIIITRRLRFLYICTYFLALLQIHIACHFEVHDFALTGLNRTILFFHIFAYFHQNTCNCIFGVFENLFEKTNVKSYSWTSVIIVLYVVINIKFINWHNMDGWIE